MQNRLLTFLVLTITFLLGSLTSSRMTGARAQQALGELSQQGTLRIPRSWGHLRGVSDKYLVFEDADGRIRVTFIESGLRNFLLVERQ